MSHKEPLTEAHKERLRQIHERLIELHPIHLELQAHLENVQREITTLCREKYWIDMHYVEVKTISRKTVQERNSKPVSIESLIACMEPEAIAALLEQLKAKAASELEEEEEEIEVEETKCVITVNRE